MTDVLIGVFLAVALAVGVTNLGLLILIAACEGQCARRQDHLRAMMMDDILLYVLIFFACSGAYLTVQVLLDRLDPPAPQQIVGF
jgi:hypothetical protein